MNALTAAGYAAAHVDRGADLDWDALERAAYSGHPEVQRLLDASASDLRTHPPRSVSVGGVLSIVFEFWPLVAFGLIVIPGRLESDPSVPSIIAAIGALGYIFTRWTWLRPGAEISAQIALLSIAQAVLGAVSAGLFLTVVDDVPGGWAWFAVFVVMTVAAAVTAVVQFARGRSRGTAPSRHAKTPVLAVREAIAALPAGERSAIAADLGSALDALQATGDLTAADAGRLRSAPLGTLARTRWASAPERRNGAHA